MKVSEIRARIASGDETARVELVEIINRVGKKIGKLRASMPGDEFVAFRRALYAMPEDEREAAVDAKLQ